MTDPPSDAQKAPSGRLSARIWLLGAAGYAVRALRVALLAEIVLFFAATGLSFFKDVKDYKHFERVLSLQEAIERPSALLVKRWLPTNFKGTDISRWLFIFAVYLLSTALGRWAEALGEAGAYARRQREAGASGDLAGLEKSLRALASGDTLDRKKLLQIYAETRKRLEGQKRHLAFVCIDVVNSTGMKIGESPEVAERDFILYKKMVERVLDANRALKSTWTPDGVMICFSTVEEAVTASQGVVRGLADFNRRVKAIRHDFALRIGINAGEVSYEDTLPMEEMTDRVIDIAGHMQKHGTIDAVCVSKHAIEPLLGRFDFKPTARVVDGCEVYEWREGKPA